MTDAEFLTYLSAWEVARKARDQDPTSARIDKARAAIDNANARANKAWSKYIDAQLASQAAKVADDNAKGTP